MKSQKGFSLIELLIVASIITLFFGGLFVTIQTSLKLIADSRVRISALSLASDTVEYMRSLSYNAVGTVNGLPSGLIPQISTTTLNGFTFTKRVLVEYVDDAADGLGMADNNSITADYKRIKVVVSWDLPSGANEVFLITTIVPASIETNVGGGTVRVNVFDANALPLPGASVRLVNDTGTSSVDVSKFTDATGAALFGGAPAGAGYEIYVTKDGYSSDQTHAATTSLPNPNNPVIAVVESDISTINFFVDVLGGIDLELLSDKTEATITASFSDTTDIATSTDITIQSGGLQLSGTSSYNPLGIAYMNSIIPSTIESWYAIVASSSVPLGTEVLYRIYTTASSTYTLVAEADLPGNAAGFLGSVDLSNLSAVTYPELVIGITLSTSNTAITPILDSLKVQYIEAKTPMGGFTFSARSSKTIGTLSDFSPVYKNTITGSTNTDGKLLIPEVEWDTYYLTSNAYDVVEACDTYPIEVSPDATSTISMVLDVSTPNSLRVIVLDSGGSPISGATVELDNGSTDTEITSFCGQVYFGSLSPAADYQLQVSAPGYSTVTIDPLNISDDVVETITL